MSGIIALYARAFEYTNAGNVPTDVAIGLSFTKEGNDWKVAGVTLRHS